MSLDSPRRAGGRAARQALRAAPLDDAVRPVRPGLEGGSYRPLKDADLPRILDAAMTALAQIGFADAPASGRAAMLRVGAVAGDDGRIRFPASVVEAALAQTPKTLTLHARDPHHDMAVEGRRVHYGTAGAAVSIVDPVTRSYRDSTVADLHQAAVITDALDNIHFLQRPMVCRDIDDVAEMDLNTLYACASGTLKHVGTSFFEPQTAVDAFAMLHLIAGGEAEWRSRPFVSNSNCFVVPPFKFAHDACLVMERCIAGGMPVLLLSAGQAGATAPAPIAGAIVQAVAECLAGLVYVNALAPGHPVIFGTWPFVSDLRSGAMSGGSGEQALLTAGCAQMQHYLGLPGGAAAGIADAKLPDMQAGWEAAMSNVMAGLAGLNLVYECAGMHASLLGFCLESLILGDDMLGQALRCVRGIEVDDDSLSLEAMRQVCLGGPGHYLGHSQTLARMQTDYIYPVIADRWSPKEWVEKGSPDLLDRARARKEAILAGPRHAALDPATDRAIRQAFRIHLPG